MDVLKISLFKQRGGVVILLILVVTYNSNPTSKELLRGRRGEILSLGVQLCLAGLLPEKKVYCNHKQLGQEV
jgi:hypothetical protein